MCTHPFPVKSLGDCLSCSGRGAPLEESPCFALQLGEGAQGPEGHRVSRAARTKPPVLSVHVTLCASEGRVSSPRSRTGGRLRPFSRAPFEPGKPALQSKSWGTVPCRGRQWEPLQEAAGRVRDRSGSRAPGQRCPGHLLLRCQCPVHACVCACVCTCMWRGGAG